MIGNTVILRKVLILSVAAVVGGTAGYFTGRLIVNQLRKKENEEPEWLEFDAEVDKNGQVTTQFVKKSGEKTDYVQFGKNGGDQKEALEVLAAQYKTSIAPTPSVPQKIEPLKGPRIIGETEWATTNLAYDKLEIRYYEEDKIFCNEQDEVIEDPVKEFGGNIQDHFGDLSDDPNVVYVRNDRISVDYQIVLKKNAYAKAVGSDVTEDEDTEEPVDPPKRTPRTRRTRRVRIEDEDKDQDS